MGRKKRKAEEDPGIPAWIVSFTDMVTLLLAFFVMLQAFAHEQHPDLLNEGQGSFKKVFDSMGTANWLEGKKKRVKREWYINRYPTKPDKNNNVNLETIDEELDELHKLFDEMQKNSQTDSENIKKQTISIMTPRVEFGKNSAKLDKSDKKYLNNIVVELANNTPPANSEVYIVGLAPDADSDADAWITSANRAKVSYAYLKQKLESQSLDVKLNCWGAGRSYGKIPKDSHLAIVVMGVPDGR